MPMDRILAGPSMASFVLGCGWVMFKCSALYDRHELIFHDDKDK